MDKKIWVGAIVVFILFAVLDMVVHGMLLASLYESTKELWRPQAEIKMWILFVNYAFIAYFFTLIFSKGYEGKGIAEGVRYGTYVGLMVALPMGYGTYAVMEIPYAMAIQWFIYGLIEFILCGVALSFVFKSKAPAPLA